MFMDIFVININKADFISDEFLSKFKFKNFSSPQKEKIHKFTYLMLDRILKNFYNIENPVVEFINEKPVLKDNKKHFSISHSGDYIVLGFSEHDCGIDIEKIKPRDYKKISERMNFKSNSLKEFYLNWTEYEAKYKLGLKSQSAYSFEIPDYMITAVDGYKDEKYEVYYNI